MNETISSKDHLTSHNIVNVCKNTIANGNEDLQNYDEADFSGKVCFYNFRLE